MPTETVTNNTGSPFVLIDEHGTSIRINPGESKSINLPDLPFEPLAEGNYEARVEDLIRHAGRVRPTLQARLRILGSNRLVFCTFPFETGALKVIEALLLIIREADAIVEINCKHMTGPENSLHEHITLITQE